MSQNGYYRHNDYLFKEKRLCVSTCSTRDLLVREAHKGGLMRHFGVQNKGGLMGHFGVQKTLETLFGHFYWPRMKHDVHKFCDHCINCKKQCHMVYIHPCLYLTILRLTFLWTLS